MDNQAKGKDYIIFAKSAEVKSKWMDAFKREKDRVAQDRESGWLNNSVCLGLCACMEVSVHCI